MTTSLIEVLNLPNFGHMPYHQSYRFLLDSLKEWSFSYFSNEKNLLQSERFLETVIILNWDKEDLNVQKFYLKKSNLMYS